MLPICRCTVSHVNHRNYTWVVLGLAVNCLYKKIYFHFHDACVVDTSALLIVWLRGSGYSPAQCDMRPERITIQRSATSVKQVLLDWCKSRVHGYAVSRLRPHSIIPFSCKPGCKPGFWPGLQPGFWQVHVRVCDTLSTIFVENLAGREPQQVRWFVRVLDKWNVKNCFKQVCSWLSTCFRPACDQVFDQVCSWLE